MRSHGKPVTDSYSPHASASKHTPRGSAGARVPHKSASSMESDMRGLEGLHRDVMQRGAAKRRNKRLEGKSI